MRRIFIFLGLATTIAALTLLFSCEEDDNSNSDDICNVSDPIEELDWLKEAIESMKDDEYLYCKMAKYKGKTVFFWGSCDPLANGSSIVVSCSGENLGYTNDLYDELTEMAVIWKHEDSQCNFEE